MRHQHIILLAMGLLWLPAVHGQSWVRLEADTIPIGDQTTLSISLDSMATKGSQIGGEGIVAVSQRIDTANHTLVTTLTCFEPGEHWIKLGKDDSLTLMVTDVEVDTASAEIRDIAPIEKVPYTFWEIFRWVLLALIVGAVAFAIWWVLTHRQKVESVFGHSEPVDTRTPQERALDDLEALRRKQLWQSGKAKEYHTELTDVVRRFIEESTDMRATDMTSDETLGEFGERRWDAERVMLQSIFTTADLVKFAKSEPLPNEHDRSMSLATEFVTTLWERVKPTPEAPKGEEVDNG